MTTPLLFLLALGLSMDAFAVAVSNGICYRTYTKAQRFTTALTFGVFQGLMPLLGFLAGKNILHLIAYLDHYIALLLLCYLGGQMLWGALAQLRHPDEECPEMGFSLTRLLVQAVATSIDALAVGLTLAALEGNILSASLLIAATTFVCSLAGVGLGRRFGILLKARAEIFGGLILIAIGVRIFVEHIFFGG